jgi:TPR repeat protein
MPSVQRQQPSIAQLEQAARAGNAMARIELGNRLIAEHPVGSENCERGLELLRGAADGPQGAAASWLLGGFYLQNLSLPGGIDQATEWMKRAADARVGPALDRLANLYIRGLGVEQQPERALALLRTLAEAGFQRAAWEVGYLLSSIDSLEDAPAAATAFARACALSFPPAYYSLGLRFAAGAGVAPDPAFGRALLLRAADAGFPDARSAADEFAPAERFGADAETWYATLKSNHAQAGPLLQQLGGSSITIPAGRAPAVDRLEAHFAAIGHPGLAVGDDGRLHAAGGTGPALRARPAAWQWLSNEPRVAVSADFVSREERAQVMAMVGGALMPPEQYTGGHVHGAAENRFFSGKGMAFGALTSDAMIRCIERRVADWTEWSPDAIEPSSVIAYRPGQEYRPHVDYFAEAQIAENRDRVRDYGGQRVVTFLICLRPAERGGDTVYPDAGVTVSHAAGAAMMHYNVLPDGSPDEKSVHHGMPVEAGEKWLLRTTLREHTRYVPV